MLVGMLGRCCNVGKNLWVQFAWSIVRLQPAWERDVELGATIAITCSFSQKSSHKLNRFKCLEC